MEKIVAHWSVWENHKILDLEDPHGFTAIDYVLYPWARGEVVARVRGDLNWHLYEAAVQCMIAVNDDHHVFIEKFQPAVNRDNTLLLYTGS